MEEIKVNDYAVVMKNIVKEFYDVRANDNVNFLVKNGSIHGLLGENGAGKTTLMNVLYGLYHPEEGEIFINGIKQDIHSPTKAISLGIGMVHQHFMLARPFTIVENVMLGRKSRKGILLDTKETAKDLVALAEKYKMKIDPYAKIWQLSVGEQQRVEILTALYQGAEVLILDEPTAVLTPQEVDGLFVTLREMKNDGKSIILITHKLEEIVCIVDEVTVLRDGAMIGNVEVDCNTTKAELTKMMVGRDVLFNFEKSNSAAGEKKLTIKDLKVLNDKNFLALDGFSLDVHAGEIIGLAGVDGNGQKELCEALTGIRTVESGEVKLDTINIENKPPLFSIKKGIAHIPEDRHITGLALGWSLKKNLILKTFKDNSKFGLIDEKKIEDRWEKARVAYQIKANSGDDSARDLSGGNQQKVILARELENNPVILIANQPTRGLDIGATEYVRQKLLDAKGDGAGVLLVSADLEEILQLSDRIAVIYDGKLMGILPGGSDVKKIGELMMGKKLEVEQNAK
ncbi:MAG: ABC transporter ATP-binding protein [Firmicutes bacterium]|nr:ABC transporter ATP-binding protein [Bacillota bacterium]